MSPYLQTRALSPLEQAYLYCVGSMKVVALPPQPEAPERRRGAGRPAGAKGAGDYGGVRKVAIGFVDGDFGDAPLGEVADARRINRESLKAAVWRVRKEREGAA